MGAKDVVKKTFSKPQDILSYRYHASKFLFVFFAVIFFLNFFFLGANYYGEIFKVTLPFIYICFHLAILTYLFYVIKYKIKRSLPTWLYIIYIVLAGVLLVYVSLPIVFENGILDVLELLESKGIKF